MKTVIKEEVDAQMKAVYGDMQTDGSLGPEAAEAIHNDAVSQFLLTEMKIMNRQAGVKPLPSPVKVLKAAAKERIASLPIAKVRPEKYRQAEARASREATQAVAAKDFNEAGQAKQRQMLNHYLYREAVRVRKQGTSMRNYLNKFGLKKKRAAMGKAGEDYLEAIDILIDGIDLRNVSLKALEARQSLADFICVTRLISRTGRT